MKEILQNYFNKYVSFSNKEMDIIYEALELRTYNKKDFLLEQGKTCTHNYFIIKGLVRFFETDSKGNETINRFGIENWWVTHLGSFIYNTPSRQAIQAIEKTTVLQINKKDLEKLYDSVPKLERAFRLITENMLIAIQHRDEVYMKKSSKERYYNLVEKIPDFAQRVPQYMIASYLDITPEYLSEIRKNK